jgi:hypothetical protein
MSYALARTSPALARRAARGASAVLLARAARVNTTSSSLLPASRCFSSDARKESERVHGELRSDRVTSKAMRRKLEKAEREEDASRAPVAVSQEPPPPPALHQHFEQDHKPPSFGQVLGANFVSGIGIALGFILIAAVLRGIGLEGGKGPNDVVLGPKPHASDHGRAKGDETEV